MGVASGLTVEVVVMLPSQRPLRGQKRSRQSWALGPRPGEGGGGPGGCTGA